MNSALIIFCEGPHDVYYVARSLEVHCGFLPYEGNVVDLPTPFGRPKRTLNSAGPEELGLVIKQSRRLSFNQSSSFDEVNFSKKPLYEYAANRPKNGGQEGATEWVLIVNCGGDGSFEQVVDVLKNIQASVAATRNAEVSSVRYSFIFDADFLVDGRGLQAREALFQKQFGGHLLPNGKLSIKHGQWETTIFGQVGLWIHHSPSDQQGTLEDHLLPMCSPDWDTELNLALGIIDMSIFSQSHARKARDKRIKAAITMAGQLRMPRTPTGAKKPRGSLVGAALNVMVKSGIPDSAFSQSKSCKALADFLVS